MLAQRIRVRTSVRSCRHWLQLVADGAGGLVDPRDANGVANAVCGLIENDERRLRLGRAGQERAATFTWERAAIETTRVYARRVSSRYTGEGELAELSPPHCPAS